jgi:SAM-dependent methyltransferase
VGSVDELLAEAATHPTSGWDFSWLGDRMRSRGIPWDYPAIVEKAAAGATSALDMGTGGGEFLVGVKSLPRRTVATEGWGPNFAVAAQRLADRSIPVVHDEGAIDNVDQIERPPRGRLAFRDGAFDLVLNRHEAYTPAEVRRVLRPGGRFLTQQADSGGADARALLGLAPSGKTLFDREIAVTHLDAAGLHVRDGDSAFETRRFSDVGAFAWYLRMIPWTVPGFTIDTHRPALERLHHTNEPIVIRSLHFWIDAQRGTS